MQRKTREQDMEKQKNLLHDNDCLSRMEEHGAMML